MQIPRPKLNYANAIATLALFVALGGAAVAAGLPKKSVGAQQLKPGAVTTKALHSKAVTAGKIAPKAVTAGKLGANAVLPGNLGDGIISTEKIADGAVIASKIKNGVVTTNKLNNAAVTTAKLGDGAVTSGKLAEGAVTSSKLGNGSVSVPKLGKGVIGQIQGQQLESGETLRGNFALGGGSLKTEKNEQAFGAVSFQFPLASTPTPTILPIGATSASCPGHGGPGGQMPQATPGHLCIYLTAFANINPSEPLNWNENSPFGFGLSTEAKEAGNAFWALGLWAVTAP